MAVERPSVRVEVLGPLRLLVDGAAVEVPGPKRRAVLALLAIAEGRVVAVDHLLDALWPSQVPESGRQALHNHVSRLRGHLGAAAEVVETRSDGYRLVLRPDELDVAQARTMLATVQRDPVDAYARLQEAHGLWRGTVLADLTDVVPIATAAEEYAQLHRDVTDALIAAGIGAGRAQDVLRLAAVSATADPLREAAALLHMRALAATGQAPEALGVGREFRRRLVDETGLDPSAELDELQREIITGAGNSVPLRAAEPPRPTTQLLGREAQVAALHRLLAAERLVTVVGPGGVGKTRVALEVARQSTDPTVVLLAPVTDPAGIPHVLAAAVNLTVDQGDVLAACLAVLGHRAGMLVIDNCEHLLGGARDTVEQILSTCPRITVLATSREPLGLPAEYVSRLAPLALPRPDQDPQQVASVALFLERARRVRPGPPPSTTELRTVADIVRRLDGMPLAIELAAGRLSTFSLTDLSGRLDRSLDLLGAGSGDPRHRTLRATIEWSYELLADDERRLFRTLSVFPDGVDLDTAERLAAELGLAADPGSILARLVDASMIEAVFEATTRYRMLETLRSFGLDRLAAAGEETAAVDRMVRWAVALTAWIGATMATEREPEADAVLRRELANLRTAWILARSRDSRADAAAMMVALFDAVAYRDLGEIRDWALELAADPALASGPQAAAALGVAGEAAYQRGDYRRAERLARAGLAQSGATGSWQCEFVLAVAALARGAFDDVIEYSFAAGNLAGPGREDFGMAALATAYAGDLATARGLNRRGAATAVSPSMRAWAAYVEGEIEGCAGNPEEAEANYLQAIDLARASGATFLVGVATVGLLSARARAGRVHEALSGYRDVVEYFARNGGWTHLWTTLRNLADLLRRLGDDDAAALIDAAADRAPDAPAVVGAAPPADSSVPPLGRAAVLDVARQAIARQLSQL
ncbi:MAG TPA: BTAD domain-containing putative transcriptional regulator [Aldersonia sp.]